jgi:hypothetical protein
MNIGEDLYCELDHGIHTTIPDFWTIFFEQHGDVPVNVNMTHNVSRKSTIPLIASMINCHLRTAVHVENFFLHP